MQIKDSLTFDDVLLIPQKSIYSPSKVSVKTQLSKKIKLSIPLVSAAMDTVTESKMAIAIAKSGGLGVIHKNLSFEKQAQEVRKVKNKKLLVGAAVSLGQKAIERSKFLAKAGVDLIVIDVAHGHYYQVGKTIKILKKLFNKKIVLVAGNVATAEATNYLIKAGADVVKVGVGPGSICTTRIIAGIGVPQLTAIFESVRIAKKTKTPIIADGGIKYSGDLVKALASGATAVMIGGLFAGSDEAPGKIITSKGKKFKIYRGMGSLEAMIRGSKDRYLQENKKRKEEIISEGVVSYVDYKGSVEKIIYQLIGGLRQGLGYCGVKNLTELSSKAKFIKISNAGLKESHPHSLVGGQILEKLGLNQEIVDAVKAHNEIHGLPRQTKMAKALFCSDPMTGLIVAATLVLPNKKIADLTTENILNRFKEKSFARGANREIISTCLEIDLSLEDFVRISLLAMQKIAKDLGL